MSCSRSRSPVLRICLGLRWLDAHPVDDLPLLFRRRVADVDLEQEAVPLGLGQRVDALVLDRVLRGHHQERVGQREGLAADRHVAFLHDLQQRRLHLRRRAVDLVGEQEVDHHRAELGVELLLALPVDAGTDDVGGHQVGRELDARERPADHPREGLHGQRLGHAGNTLEQDVALGQQADQHPLHELVLADDDPFDLEDGPLQRVDLGGQPIAAARRRFMGRRAGGPTRARVTAGARGRPTC